MLTMNSQLASLLENQAYEKREICEMVISHGVDLSTALNNDIYYLPVSILVCMYSAGPRTFVHDFAYYHIGIHEYSRSSRVNSWILRTIARADSRFSAKLKSETEALQYSTNVAVQKKKSQCLDFSIETQSKEMKQSDPCERHAYLAAICAGGTAFEVDALLAWPEQIPELDICEEKGLRSRVYLEISAACGNVETFRRLIVFVVNYRNHRERL